MRHSESRKARGFAPKRAKRRPPPVTCNDFLTRLREIEAVRIMEFSLELNALTCDDPVYHPIGRGA